MKPSGGGNGGSGNGARGIPGPNGPGQSITMKTITELLEGVVTDWARSARTLAKAAGSGAVCI